MIKTALPSTILFVVTLCFSPIAAKAPASLTINPTVSSYDSSFTGKSYMKGCFLQPVVNLVAGQDTSGIVGETRVGWKKMIPVICKPAPSDCIFSSFQTFLTATNCAASSENEAEIVIELSISTFSLKESYNKITQTMDAFVTLEVALLDKNNTTPPKRFQVTTQNTYTTLDTSSRAEKILRDALIEAIRKISENLQQ